MKIVTASFALVLFAAPLANALCGEDKLEEQYMAVGAARAKTELAFRKVQGFYQNPQNFHDWGRFDDAKNRISQKLHQDLDAERNKPEADRDIPRIDKLQARIDSVEQDWQNFQRDHQSLDQRFQMAEQRFHAIEQVFNSISNTERQWKEALLDMQALVSCYEMLSGGLNQAREQGEELVKEQGDKLATWKATLADVMTPAPAPAAAKAPDKAADGKPAQPF